MPRTRVNGLPDKRATSSPFNACKTLEDPEDAIKAGILAQSGSGRRTLFKQTELTTDQSKQLARLVGMPADVFREEVASRLQAIIDRLTERLHAEADELPVGSLAINIGILTDKYLLLRGIAAPTTVNQTNIQINGVDRSSAMGLLSNRRKPADAISSLPAALPAPQPPITVDLSSTPIKDRELVSVSHSDSSRTVWDGQPVIANDLQDSFAPKGNIEQLVPSDTEKREMFQENG